MIHPLGLMSVDVNQTFEQPLPWNAPEVHVRFHDGRSYTGKVCRLPGDTLRLDSDDLAIPVGTPVDVQWTQENRGCYAAGTVTGPPAGAGPGLFLLIEESVSGVERRLGVRLPVQVPVSLVSDFGQVFPGYTANLSLGGARVVLDSPRPGADLAESLVLAGITAQSPATVVLTLPAGRVSLACLVVVTGRIPGEVRLRFVHDSGLALEQIGALLRAEQRRVALRRDSAAPVAGEPSR